MSDLVIIAALAQHDVIGITREGRPTLPWRLPEDLRHFKALTLGHPVIMGRKTWESLGRALPGRHNLVVSRQAGYRAEGASVVDSLDAALAECAGATAFVIGGAQIYAQALTHANRLELTEIAADFPGDTYFPAHARQGFTEVARQTQRAEAGFDYAFVSYVRSA